MGHLLDPECESYVRAVAFTIEDVLGHNLVGVYLHGSGALGGFSRERSDIDVLAVCREAISAEQKSPLSESLSESSLPCPAVGLEFSLVTREVAQHPTQSPGFELHITTIKHDEKVVDGAGHPGDTDLVMHFAVCRERGRAIVGPPSEEVFAPIPRAWLLKAFADEIEWAEQNASLEYRLLNACRSWRFADEGILGSKVEGGDWARARVPNPKELDAALAFQRGEARGWVRREDVDAFVARVRELLTSVA